MPTPNAPTNFLVSRLGIDHTSSVVNKAAVRFTFTNNQAGATHVIQQSLNGTSGWKDVLEIGDGESTADLSKLALNDKFWWRIRSEFASQGTFSAWVNASTNPTQTAKLPTAAVQINAPAGLAVTNNDYRNVTIAWTDNANNESNHILKVSGPGLPSGGVDVPIYHLDAGKFVFPIGFPFYSGYSLTNAKTYTVSVRARGGKQTTGSNTFDTDATADLSFTTAAFRVALVNVPSQVSVDRGQPFSFRLIANTTATFSVLSGSLPTGLSLTGDTISGTTTVADTTVNVTIRATDGVTSDDQVLTLKVQTPLFKFTNLPSTSQAWNSVNFQFAALTNTPAASISIVSGSLPSGITDDGDGLLGGAPDALDGPYPVLFRASNALGTTADGLLSIQVSTPQIVVRLKPHGSTAVPKPGPDWGTITAPLGVLFQWDVSASVIGPISAGNTTTLVSGPSWLSLTGTTLLTGTPTHSGDSTIVVEWSNGTFSGQTSLLITVPAVQITNANNFSVYEGQDFSFPLSSSPAGAVFGFSDPDEIPAGLSITSNSPGHYVLAGKVEKVGVYSFEIVAVAGEDRTTMQFSLTVRSLIEVEGGDLINGFQGEPVLQILSFKGEGTVSEWFLVDAPPGVEISTDLSCPGPYEGTKTVVAIAGKPTANGRFQSTVVVQICNDGLPEIHRHSVVFEIGGGFYIPEIHSHRELYDLQFQARGNLINRALGSFYATQKTDGEPSKKTIETTKSTVPGSEGQTTLVKEEGPLVGGKESRLMVVKRDDEVIIAIVIRDGRSILGPDDGITEVMLCMRLLDSSDGEYVFKKDAEPTVLDGVSFFQVDLAVDSPMLTDLMGDDGLLAEPVKVVAEVRCKINGAPISSDTGIIEIAEDVYTK